MNILWHMPALRDHCDGLSQRALALAAGLAERGHAVTFCAPADKIDIANFSEAETASPFAPSWAQTPHGKTPEGTHRRRLESMPPSACRLAGYPAETLDSAVSESAVYFARILALPIQSATRPLHWSLQSRARERATMDQIARIAAPHDVFVSSQTEAITAYRRLHPAGRAVFVCGSSTLLFDEFDRQRHHSRAPLKRIAFALDRAGKHRNERRAFAAADLCIFDSCHTRERVLRAYRIPTEKCHTIYGGVDPARFRPPDPVARRSARTRLELPDDDVRLIVSTGRLARGKGFDLLVSALAELRSPARVLIVGDGPDRAELESLARANGLASRVCFLGKRRDPRDCLAAADIFAFPSVCESFGAALAEALAYGVACVGFRPDGHRVCNANPEMIRDGVTGLLCDPTPAALACTLDRLIADAPLRRRLGAAAAQFVRDRFTWQHGGAHLADLIERLTGTTAENSSHSPATLRTLPQPTTDTAGASAASAPRGPSEERSPCVLLPTSVS